MSKTIHRTHDRLTFNEVAPGVEFAVLRQHDTNSGLTTFVRMQKGARARHHGHPGGEETYLVSGRLRVGDTTLGPGDYLWTAEGESHDGFAEEASLFFVVLPGGLEVNEEAPVPASSMPADAQGTPTLDP